MKPGWRSSSSSAAAESNGSPAAQHTRKSTLLIASGLRCQQLPVFHIPRQFALLVVVRGWVSSGVCSSAAAESVVHQPTQHKASRPSFISQSAHDTSSFAVIPSPIKSPFYRCCCYLGLVHRAESWNCFCLFIVRSQSCWLAAIQRADHGG